MNTTPAQTNARRAPDAPLASAADTQPDHRHDFDFLHGYWHVAHRKLRSRLSGCTDWEEFESTQQCWPLLGGICNVDESRRLGAAVEELPGAGHIGASVRCFDLANQHWRIYWVSASDGLLGMPPVVGGFADGVGIFEADEMIGGRIVRVRFTWTVLTPTTAHWQQGFSLDQGMTWEVNWTMSFTRIAAGEFAQLHADQSARVNAGRG